MNFSLPPRPHTYSQYANSSRHGRRHGSAFGLGYNADDKARYVYGNYRFIVDPRFDYHEQSLDADRPLDWSHILQVLASSQSQGASCPICLGTPVAARMAKCGHIFCLPCLIRYMHSEDDKTRQNDRREKSKSCPLCWDHISLNEVKPVRWYEGQETTPREGQDLVLRLMKRSAGSTLALPRDGAENLAEGNDIPWYYAAEIMDYARIMKGIGHYMIQQFDAEISALEQQEKEDELMFGDDNAEWTRKALRALNDAKTRTGGDGQLQIETDVPEKPPAAPKRPPIEFISGIDVPDMYAIQHASKSGHDLHSYVASNTVRNPEPQNIPLNSSNTPVSDNQVLAPTPVRTARLPSQPASEYYFYQALLHYYLSPLDIRILKEAFGSYAAFPTSILPRVERVSTGHVVDDDLRKRNRWLGHLPRGCEVNFLECDWTDTVPSEILEKFKEEIERRRKRNEDKEAREERDRLRAEREEERRYAHLRRRRFEESPPRQFHKDDFQPLVPENEVENEVDIPSSTPPWGNRAQGSAFTSLANMSTSPSTSRTIWGTPVVPPSTPPLVATEDTSKDDGWLQGWEEALLEEKVNSQVEALAINAEGAKPATIYSNDE
jgi:hypothetical protein